MLGYRVLDLTDGLGSFCTKLLADFGADVIKVEPPEGAASRRQGPFRPGGFTSDDSLYFAFYNTNKRSLTLNLGDAQGQELFRKLVERSDALVEDKSLGEVRRSGIEYKVLKAINPRLVMTSISPYGRSGPWSQYLADDLTVMAASGYLHITGEPDEKPILLGNAQSHFPGSQFASVVTLAALFHRDNVSGRGQWLDVSAMESLLVYYMDRQPG
jgi:benzylsuccinate CoA-transferase BbsE subunit